MSLSTLTGTGISEVTLNNMTEEIAKEAVEYFGRNSTVLALLTGKKVEYMESLEKKFPIVYGSIGESTGITGRGAQQLRSSTSDNVVYKVIRPGGDLCHAYNVTEKEFVDDALSESQLLSYRVDRAHRTFESRVDRFLVTGTLNNRGVDIDMDDSASAEIESEYRLCLPTINGDQQYNPDGTGLVNGLFRYKSIADQVADTSIIRLGLASSLAARHYNYYGAISSMAADGLSTMQSITRTMGILHNRDGVYPKAWLSDMDSFNNFLDTLGRDLPLFRPEPKNDDLLWKYRGSEHVILPYGKGGPEWTWTDIPYTDTDAYTTAAANTGLIYMMDPSGIRTVAKKRTVPAFAARETQAKGSFFLTMAPEKVPLRKLYIMGFMIHGFALDTELSRHAVITGGSNA